MRKPDVRALEIAAQQHSAISWNQLREAGLSARQIRDRVGDGALLRFGFRSLAIGGSPDTFERRAICTLIEFPGSALGSTTACAYYGATGLQLEPIHILAPRATRQPKTFGIDVRVHRSLYLPPHHIAQVNSLVVTTPTRACADYANLPKVRPEKAARIVETLWAARLTDRRRLAAMAEEWCERGRKGSAFLHDFLGARPAEWLPPESNLERRFANVIENAGMPRPRSQVNSGSDAWFGRVDMLDPELPLIAEIDSDRFHTAPLDVANDERRDEQAKAAGYETERFTEHEVWHEPGVVVARWSKARRRVARS